MENCSGWPPGAPDNLHKWEIGFVVLGTETLRLVVTAASLGIAWLIYPYLAPKLTLTERGYYPSQFCLEKGLLNPQTL